VVTLIYAHRGFHQVERENTLESFVAAADLGVDGVELDVHRSLDGHLVVHHDPVVMGREIASTPRTRLPGYIPTLEESMVALADVRVNVELKVRPRGPGRADPPGVLARQVLDAVEEGGWSHKVLISSFSFEECLSSVMHDEKVPVGWAVEGTELRDALSRAHSNGLHAVHPYFTALNESGMALAGEFGLDVNVWTVNEAPDIERAIGLGVDIVITDEPELAMQVRDGLV
jgi:glycerophosphoryl diester phosphodiesterase